MTPVGIVDIDPVTVGVEPVAPDPAVAGILIEIVDRDGNGARTVLDPLAALEMVQKVIAAVASLRGYATPGSAP